MNQAYLKEHVREELEGAKDYIMRAIEIKAMDPSWGKMLYNMSVEYFNKVSSAYKEPPKYLEDCMNEITEMYTECFATIKKMHEMYSK